jgi:phage-related protein
VPPTSWLGRLLSIGRTVEDELLPPVQVVFYMDDDGTVPMIEWLENLWSQPKHRAKCIKWLTLLRDQGHELRRPKADLLRDGIYELRVRLGFENYRMLYFFFGRGSAVVTHGIIKHTDEVPAGEIDKSLKLKRKFENDPTLHTHDWEP